MVIDVDHWTESQIKELFEWAAKEQNRGIAVSNPNFEYWLLLHFESGNIKSSSECKQRLERHLPNYKKQIDSNKLNIETIRLAIDRAKLKDTSPTDQCPRRFSTTVYRLVEKLIP